MKTKHTQDLSVLIWSMEHGAWWRPDSRGYTICRAEAGVYSRREATEIVAGSGGRRERIEEMGADDFLWRAAPDLLEACEMARQTIMEHGYGPRTAARLMLENAIAKATGGKP